MKDPQHCAHRSQDHATCAQPPPFLHRQATLPATAADSEGFLVWLESTERAVQLRSQAKTPSLLKRPAVHFCKKGKHDRLANPYVRTGNRAIHFHHDRTSLRPVGLEPTTAIAPQPLLIMKLMFEEPVRGSQQKHTCGKLAALCRKPTTPFASLRGRPQRRSSVIRPVTPRTASQSILQAMYATQT